MKLVIPQHFLPSNYDNFLICEVEIKIPQPVLEHTSQSLEVANLWVLKQAELPQPIPNQGCLAMSKDLPCGSAGKESACNVGDLGSNPGLEDPLEKGMATHSSILAGKFHGQRSLMGYSPWGHKELDTTERLTLLLVWKTTL